MKLKRLDLDGYEAKMIGIERYKEIARKHNLFTQKWTYGRLKEFSREIQEEIDIKISKKKSLFKRLKRRKNK